MNSIRQIQELNKRELENNVSPEASWHADYRDTAYVYIGGLPFELSEGDVITIFSQFGEPAYINLVRDKETGKSRGFAFLKYEDQRSTDLAVDNLGGAVIMGRTLRVDHTRYKKKDDEEEMGINLLEDSRQTEADSESLRKRRRTNESESEEERPMIEEEIELAKLIQDHDEEDPMKPYLIQEKREEVVLALARIKKSGKSRKHRHHHHRSRRSKNEGEDADRTRHSRSDRRENRRSRSQERSEPAQSVSAKRGKSEYESQQLDDGRIRNSSIRDEGLDGKYRGRDSERSWKRGEESRHHSYRPSR